ncbi:EamA-like transporter family [Desulfosporosinus orientis DSM 765]|uniref:EamA-like transporter family n=1 Tax=Desulfosporosinus orientis (strain ATCC 19365 / DSM 765 / NCIMB 8382 / VKM B-1628 / Singapore I) TaxID=768706 RepID=G7W9Q3_DESOD|nr:DMT family transporter [Desulfosporosinus orientis]AET70619.1 EamA-like transporter family [Desulfosporosinus orientis DSM 765]
MKLNKSHWADLSLLLVTFVWGSTFVIVKWAIADLPPFPFLAVRFALAFVSLLPFLWFQKAHLNKTSILQGAATGIFLFSGYAWQTIGLQYTTSSNAGFITGLSVVIVPALVAATTRKLPSRSLLLGVLCALAGLGFLSLGNGFQLNNGDLMILICAISFALQIFFVGRYAPQANATVLASIQILTVSLLSGFASLLLPQPTIYFSSTAWYALLVTAIPATSLAFFVQSKMQQFTTPTHTALIFSMEPVFAAVSAFFLAGELLTAKGYFGAALVLIGMLIAEFSGSKHEQLSQ